MRLSPQGAGTVRVRFRFAGPFLFLRTFAVIFGLQARSGGVSFNYHTPRGWPPTRFEGRALSDKDGVDGGKKPETFFIADWLWVIIGSDN